MGRHNAPKRPSRAVPLLGGSAAALATAASLAALQTIPVSSAEVYEAGPSSPGETALAGEESPAAGPLAIPSIGVVAPGFDQLVELMGVPTTTQATVATDYQVGAWTMPTPPAPAPATPTGAGPVPAHPAPTSPPPPNPPSDPGEPSEEPDPTPTDERPSETPDPPGEPPPTGEPTEQPTEEPAEEPPPVEEPTEEPPPIEPDPPADVVLPIGSAFDVVDAASGAVLYSITVVGVTADVACTASGATTAQNGHLVAVQLLVSTAAGGTAIDATDFLVTAADGTTTDPATTAAATCLPAEEGLPAGPLPAGQEYSGTVVLDVPVTTGSIVHRPDPLAAGAVWSF